MTKLTDHVKENIELVKTLSTQLYPDQPFLAQLSVAQAILESNLEEKPSELALVYCNLFGIKPGWIRTGTHAPGTVYLNTHEWIENKGMVLMKQPFLWNNSVEDSIKQHKQLLVELDRYKNLASCTSFTEIAEKIRADGYATDPKYPAELLAVYKRNNLGEV